VGEDGVVWFDDAGTYVRLASASCTDDGNEGLLRGHDRRRGGQNDPSQAGEKGGGIAVEHACEWDVGRFMSCRDPLGRGFGNDAAELRASLLQLDFQFEQNINFRPPRPICIRWIYVDILDGNAASIALPECTASRQRWYLFLLKVVLLDHPLLTATDLGHGSLRGAGQLVGIGIARVEEARHGPRKTFVCDGIGRLNAADLVPLWWD
jgi:hypothetical protein